jgi:hypothetical protein
MDRHHTSSCMQGRVTMWPVALFMSWLLGFLIPRSPPDKKVPKWAKLLVTYFVSVILAWFLGAIVTVFVPMLATYALAVGQELGYLTYGIVGLFLGLITYAVATYLKV